MYGGVFGLLKIYYAMFELIAGVDEVGTGAAAGPMTFGLVVVSRAWAHEAVKDSKKFSSSKSSAHQKREKVLREVILPASSFYLTSCASAQEIDQFGSGPMQLRCVQRLVLACRERYPDITIIVDGDRNFHLKGVVSRPKADATVPAVSAASILAKVTRDQIMLELERVYPGYGFGSGKGYGTDVHLKALKLLGPSPVHRRSVVDKLIPEWQLKTTETNG